MALLGSITKQSREIIDVDLDYTTCLAGRTDTIISQTTEVLPSAQLICTPTKDGNIIKLTLAAGTTATSYKVTCLATTAVGLVYEDELNVLVEDI